MGSELVFDIECTIIMDFYNVFTNVLCTFFLLIVQIYDGYDSEAPILFRQCRGSNPAPVTSTGNVVFIEYNKMIWYNWFKISWREVQSPNGLDSAGFRLNVTGRH